MQTNTANREHVYGKSLMPTRGPDVADEGSKALDDSGSLITIPEPLGEAGTYASPPATCDIVMKGGITSGIVYPWTVCDLAGRYRLVNVGGTSAGAIAAAAAAAAEYGRLTPT